jgi:iron complex transport system ATP-binding protein
VLAVDGLGFAWRASEWVFREVSFAVAPGTVTAVLGPNGRGKTTLVRCAAGLLGPGEGTVRRIGPIGYVPQARGGAFAFPVREMVLMGRVRQVGVFAVPGPGDRAAAARSMARVGIEHLAERPFPSLSGGEQQLVLIARAIAGEQPILVLDEPATGLDLANQGQVLRLVRSLAGDGLSVLLTTHQPEHALLVADAVVLMHAVDDVRCGPAVDLLTDENLSALYGVRVRSLGLPGTSGPVEGPANGRVQRSLVVDFGLSGRGDNRPPVG